MGRTDIKIFGLNVYSRETRSVGDSGVDGTPGISSLTTPSAGLMAAFGGRASKTGISVNEYTALNFSAVWRCIDLISGHVASLPVSPYKWNGDGGSTLMEGHSMYRLLHSNPCGFMTAYSWKKLMEVWELTYGNAYAYIRRNGIGEVVALVPIHPTQIYGFVYDGKLFYNFSANGVMIGQEGIPGVLMPWEVLHFKGLSQDGITGRGVVQAAKETIGLGLAAEEFGARFYANGANSELALISPQALTTDVYGRLRDSFEEQYSGLSKSHRPILLEAGLDVKMLTIPPEQAQFLGTRQFQVIEICRWFGMPPHKVFELERSTNNNIEHQAMEYLTDTLMPHLENWEAELNLKLLSPREVASMYYGFDTNVLLRGDIAARMTLYKTLFNMGGLSANEAREREGMNPLKDGDKRFIPVNTIPYEMAGQNITNKISKTGSGDA